MTAIQHWFEEVWNKKNAAAIDELWVPGKSTHGLAAEYGKTVKSKAEFKDFHKLFCTAFPDLHVEIQDTVSEGDKTVARVLVPGPIPAQASRQFRRGNDLLFTACAWRESRTARSSNHGTTSIS